MRGRSKSHPSMVPKWAKSEISKLRETKLLGERHRTVPFRNQTHAGTIVSLASLESGHALAIDSIGHASPFSSRESDETWLIISLRKSW